MRDFYMHVDPDGHIYLLSNDKNFLIEKGKTIQAYAINTNLPQSQGEIVIEEVNVGDFMAYNKKIVGEYESRKKIEPNKRPWTLSKRYFEEAEENLLRAFSFSLCLDSILPEFVKTVIVHTNLYRRCSGYCDGYGNQESWNCHGTAQAVSGNICTIRVSFNAYESDEWFLKINPSELSPGDVIDLGEYNHSFLFLDQDICLSANGIRSPLKIHTIEEVLQTYGVQSLEQANFYRKSNENLFSKRLVDTICEQTKLCTQFAENWLLPPEIYSQHFDLLKILYSECYQSRPAKEEKLFHSLFCNRLNWCASDYESSYKAKDVFDFLSKVTEKGIFSVQEGLSLLELPVEQQLEIKSSLAPFLNASNVDERILITIFTNLPSKDIKTALIKIVHEHITYLTPNWHHFTDLIKSLSLEDQDIFISAMGEHIKTIIQDGYLLAFALQQLPTDRRTSFITALDKHIASIIDDEDQLIFVLDELPSKKDQAFLVSTLAEQTESKPEQSNKTNRYRTELQKLRAELESVDKTFEHKI